MTITIYNRYTVTFMTEQRQITCYVVASNRNDAIAKACFGESVVYDLKVVKR